MAEERLQTIAPKGLGRYLFATEKVQFRLRQHWFRVIKPIGAVVGGTVLYVVLLGAFQTMNPEMGTILFFALVVAPLLWLLWAYLEWQREWFMVTDRRIMLVHGVIVRRVAIMPLSKVTDMAYNRSPIAKLFGYGEFVFESAGQDQALTRVPYVSRPDLHYRQISALIFAPPMRRAYDKLLPFATGSAMPISEPEDAWWRR